jgi:hypothetical protein
MIVVPKVGESAEIYIILQKNLKYNDYGYNNIAV